MSSEVSGVRSMAGSSLRISARRAAAMRACSRACWTAVSLRARAVATRWTSPAKVTPAEAEATSWAWWRVEGFGGDRDGGGGAQEFVIGEGGVGDGILALRGERGFLGAHALLGGEFLVVDVTKIPLGVEADAGGERAFVGIDDAALDGLEVIFVLAEGEAGGDPREQAFASDIGVGAGLGEFFPGDADREIVGTGEAQSRDEVDGLWRGEGEEGRGDEGDSGEGERTRE